MMCPVVIVVVIVTVIVAAAAQPFWKPAELNVGPNISLTSDTAWPLSYINDPSLKRKDGVTDLSGCCLNQAKLSVQPLTRCYLSFHSKGFTVAILGGKKSDIWSLNSSCFCWHLWIMVRFSTAFDRIRLSLVMVSGNNRHNRPKTHYILMLTFLVCPVCQGKNLWFWLSCNCLKKEKKSMLKPSMFFSVLSRIV